MWQKSGRLSRFIPISALVVLAAVILFGSGIESTAEAKFLKNGVRKGDRSSMTIIRRPGAGARKRIFAPGERRPGTKRGGRSGRGGKKTSHAWFWKIHATGSSAASASRFTAALTTLDNRRASGKGLVDVARLRTILTTHRQEIAAAARTHRVSEALILAVISVESRGATKAVSPKGAQGLMQLIPATAKRFGVTDSFDPGQNINGGTAYLSWLLKEFRGDPLLALAGYNAGEGAVRKHKGIPPYSETRDYVVKVFDALSAAKELCAAPLTSPRQRCLPAPDAG